MAWGAVSLAGVPESGQTLTTWAGRALTCARYTQDPNDERCRGLLDASGGAGVLSRGVGLRGFESHPPHQLTVNVNAVICKGKLPRFSKKKGINPIASRIVLYST